MLHLQEEQQQQKKQSGSCVQYKYITAAWHVFRLATGCAVRQAATLASPHDGMSCHVGPTPLPHLNVAWGERWHGLSHLLGCAHGCCRDCDRGPC